MSLIYLLETTGKTVDGTAVPIRIASGQGYNHPSAPGFFEGRLAEYGDFGISATRSVFTGGKFGAGEIDLGLLRIVARDGGIDDWLEYGWGNTASLKLGEQGGDYVNFTEVVNARIRELSPDLDLFSLVWESRLAELDNPASPATYAGTNSGATGLEGTVNDLQGKRKLRASGVNKNLTPDLLNSVSRVLGWNHDKAGNRAATHSVDAVRFTGKEWALDTAKGTNGDYPDSATMLADTAPLVGYYVTCLAESLILMGGSNPLNGAVTIDVTIEATAAERYAGNQLAFWLEDAGVVSADISADDLAELNTAAPYEAGILVRDEEYREVCDLLAGSVAAWYVPDRQGVYRMQQVQAPASLTYRQFVTSAGENLLTSDGENYLVPVTQDPVAAFKRFGYGAAAALNEGDILSIRPVPSGGQWIPAKSVKLEYARNWTPLSAGDVADTVSDADRQFLTQEYRQTDPLLDATVAGQFSNAQTLTHTSLLATQAGAEAVGYVLAGIYGSQRREYEAELAYGSDFAATLDLGAVISITHPRLGFADGQLAVIHSLAINDKSNTAKIRIWL